MSVEPRVDRPVMPDGYGVESAVSYLTWAEVERRLVDATAYWLASTRRDGRPHVVPRWGVWLDGVFWYDGSPETLHAVNVEANPACTLHLESGESATIVEGVSRAAEPVVEELGRRLAAEYARKYAPAYAPEPDAWSDDQAGGMRVVTPSRAIAWTRFPDDVTRFTF